MRETLEVLSKVLPVIILIIFGVFLRKTRFIEQNTVSELKKNRSKYYFTGNSVFDLCKDQL